MAEPYKSNIRHYLEAGTKRSTMVNCGYDPTCAGWVIREGSSDGEHVATCRTEKLANEFVELFNRPELGKSE